MATITSVTFQQFANDEYATIKFSDGLQYYAMCVYHDENMCIIYFNRKLTHIGLKDYSCKVLKEGVSIR